MSVFDRLLLPENLNYAWIKAKNLYRTADGFIDAGEVAAFELDLERSLLGIRRQFEQGSYRLKKLRPLPRPKKVTEDGPINRQYFHVAIEDQVAWIALVNALGPELDLKMEPWSYGNRLYRPAWYEPDEASRSRLEIGPYRHASGHLYRKFQHSWPLFRRHITLTARMMVLRRRLRQDEMDEADKLAAVTAEQANLIYFRRDFWAQENANSSNHDLFHASIDLEKFYPELNHEAVVRGLADAGALKDPRIVDLVMRMLKFRIDMTGVPATGLKNVEPPFRKGNISGIPTGLFVSGFLANAAMLPVDKIVAKKLLEFRNIAHFRFVDDHSIIAYDFNELCNWIIWYENLLKNEGIGPQLNPRKFDPPELGDWLKIIKEGPSAEDSKKQYSSAMREARLDGKNPTKLMTKTLAQVSAIATTDVHILDDDDLDERLKMLEWLLLADIPEREIRSDTRAAFAAGQIASLVPVLVQEADSLVETARQLAEHKLRKPDPERSTNEDLQKFEQKTQDLQDLLSRTKNNHDKEELSLLKRCFSLLIQSLQEHPGKARLFYRIHQYCRVTGHKGLSSIGEWLADTRANGRDSWADYFAALSLQIMAKGILATLSKLTASDAMQSDKWAALRHIEDVASIDVKTFCVSADRETWFHATGRNEFGVALMQAAATLESWPGCQDLANRLNRLSKSFVTIALGAPASAWQQETGWTSGVWAHLAENSLGNEAGPSPAWTAFAPKFSFRERLDLAAARRYPENYPDVGWMYLLGPAKPLPKNDSAWLCQVIGDDKDRLAAAQGSGKRAFSRAARSLIATSSSKVTISEWTRKLSECSPFDPRRAEWTALEIVRQLLDRAVSVDWGSDVLSRIHPDNVLLPLNWITDFPLRDDTTKLGWEEWRALICADDASGVELREVRSCISDYRYANSTSSGIQLGFHEQNLVSVGRLLLGLLRNDHSAPRIWNIRGNELVFRLPRARWFQELAISSTTTQLLEACLAARPAETRLIALKPELFAWTNGRAPNDAAFDPKPIFGLNDLIEDIQKAQRILQDNQLSVSNNQPRQLIPFRISDFAAGTEDTDADFDDGGGNGE